MNEENKVKCSAYGNNPQECELYPDCDDCSGNITKLNMTQEEIKLLYQDLCGRLPYGVKVTFAGYSGREDCILNSQHLNSTYAIEYLKLKPYLRPMSSMTEEEKREYIEYAGYEIEESVNGRHYEYYLKDFCGTPNNPSVNADGIDWLNKHHFDYRGLIPKGLALEAKGGMYNK